MLLTHVSRVAPDWDLTELLSSKERDCITSAISALFPLKKFLGTLGIEPGATESRSKFAYHKVWLHEGAA